MVKEKDYYLETMVKAELRVPVVEFTSVLKVKKAATDENDETEGSTVEGRCQ